MRTAGGAIFNGVEEYVSAPTAIPMDTWTHVATTYDGATLRVYINGTQMASRAMSGGIQVNADALRIGGSSYPNSFFQGTIDEVRIYSRALSQSEIQADMNKPVAGGAP